MNSAAITTQAQSLTADWRDFLALTKPRVMTLVVFTGLAGLPRRVPDYNMQFADFNMISSLGAFGFGLSQLLLVYVVFSSIRGGQKATDKVWEGAQGLEWTIPSPPPYHTFETPPVVK